MIDIEKEAAKLVQGWVLNDMNDPHARESLEGRVIALCRRVAAEQLEEDAERLDRIAKSIVPLSAKCIVRDCAAAIRSRKEEGR